VDELVKTFVVRAKAGRLRRTRTEVKAVDDVSFSITAGSTVGYIGPNGGCRMVQLVVRVDRRAGRGGRCVRRWCCEHRPRRGVGRLS
jgi:ABC-type glutathione transport system ATPase component